MRETMPAIYKNPWLNPAAWFFMLGTFPVGLIAVQLRHIGNRQLEKSLASLTQKPNIEAA